MLRQKIRLGAQALGQTSEEELNQLSAKVGRAAPPTSPMGASGIGANPDQAKMAGSREQKQSALNKGVAVTRLGLGPEDNLRDRLRRYQTRDVATASEQQKIDKASGLERLGGLDDRVEALVQKQRQTALASDTTDITAALDSMIPPELKASAAPVITKIRKDPSDLKNINELAGVLGITSPDQIGELVDKVTGLFSGANEAELIAGQAEFSDISVKDLNVSELGFQDINELASLLDVSTADLEAMNVTDLINKVQEEQQTEFNQVSALQAKLADPMVGPAERAQARGQLRELGAVGVRAAETDVEKLAQQIEDDDTVMFAGEEISISELVNDEYMAGVVANYLEDPEGEFAINLRETDPELASWIDDNKAGLAAASSEITDAAKELVRIQEANRQVLNKTTLNEDLLATIIPGYNQIALDEINLDSYPLLKLVHEEQSPLSLNRRTTLIGSINQLYDINPELAKSLVKLPESTLTRLGALDNTDKWRDLVSYQEQQQRIKRANPEDLDSVVDAVFGPGRTPEEVLDILEEARKKIRSGIFSTSVEDNKIFGLIPKAGELPSPEVLLEIAKAMNPEASLGAEPDKSLQDIFNKTESLANNPDPTGIVYNMISDYLGPQDREITVDDLNKIIGGAAPRDIAVLYEHLDKLPGDTNRLKNEVVKNYKTSPEFDELRRTSLNHSGNPETTPETIEGYLNKHLPFSQDAKILLEIPKVYSPFGKNQLANASAQAMQASTMSSKLTNIVEATRNLRKAAEELRNKSNPGLPKYEQEALRQEATKIENAINKINPWGFRSVNEGMQMFNESLREQARQGNYSG